eukprot:scaffold42317_cov27-Prasinocladus_malaysianus.AAC.2
MLGSLTRFLALETDFTSSGLIAAILLHACITVLSNVMARIVSELSSPVGPSSEVMVVARSMPSLRLLISASVAGV